MTHSFSKEQNIATINTITTLNIAEKSQKTALNAIHHAFLTYDDHKETILEILFSKLAWRLFCKSFVSINPDKESFIALGSELSSIIW